MQRGSLIIAILTIALGVIVVLASFGIFPVSDEGFAAPRWVVGLAGSAFLTAGVLLLLTLQRRADVHEITAEAPLKVFLRGGLTVVLLAIFAVLSHWIAFGSGGSNFANSAATPLPAFSSSAGGVVGRLVFMAGALLIDGLLVLGVIDLIRRVMHWRSTSPRE